MMKRRLLVGSIACFSILVIAFAIATAQGMKGLQCDVTGPGMMLGHQGGKMGLHKNPYLFFKKHAEEIGLTEDQLNRIEQLCTEARKKMIELKAEIETFKVDLHAEMENDNPDRSVVFKLLDEINAIHGELRKTGVTLYLDIKDILTPEQMMIANEIREKMRAERMKMRGKGFQKGNRPEEF